MRILFFSLYFPPEGNAPASRVHEISREWAKNGHSVTVITSHPNYPNGIIYDGYRNVLYKRETVDGIKVIRVWTFIAANKGVLLRIVNYLSYMITAVFAACFVKKPDIIIATSPQFFCGWAGVIISKLRKLPFILEIRDIWPDGITVHGVLTNKYISSFLEFLERKMYSAATCIVTVGKGYKHVLVTNKGLAAEDIFVLTNGADLDTYFPRPRNEQLKHRLALKSAFVCAYIGNIAMAQGLSIVNRAAKLLYHNNHRDITFLLVGDGVMRENIEKEAKEKKLNNVVFVGRQKKELIPQFYSIADACLVHLKKAELYKTTLPSKIFEICAMGKPVILGVEGDAADIIKAANAGICIQPENEVQLVEAVKELADNRSLAKQYGQSGRNYIIEHFDRKKLARDYLALIQKIHQSS